MGNQYLTYETEEKIEHGDDDSNEIRYVEIDGEELEASIQGGQLVIKEGSDLKAKEGVKTALVKEICSCGSFTCSAIKFFGHPESLYEREILPLPSQYEKDKLAAFLKGTSTQAGFSS